jgi:2-oxoglutarate dehydrogenase E2 component (dihydrolipoamide succinyltransferase)
MATPIIMPQMGESIAEGTITKWYKKLGDHVERDEPLFEISTDKVDTEIPSPTAGVLTEIKVGEGETVPINTVVGVIGDAAGEAVEPVAAEPSLATTQPTVDVPSEVVAPPREGVPEPTSAKAAAGDRQRSSPLVRRMARENNVDLSQIQGTGTGGRITKQDISSFLEQGAPPAVAAEPIAPPSPKTTAAAPVAAAPVPSPTAGYTGRVHSEPMSVMRKSIAEHMVMSRRTSAHVSTVWEANMTRIVKLRQDNRGRFEREEDVKLTYMPFFIRAVLHGLKAFPIVNSSLDGSNVIYKKDLNIGVAVALDWGLIVPVLHRADEKSFLGLQRAVNDLATRARNKKLKPEEVQGGTFTITNPGPFGALYGTPIINQPEVAILGLGGIHKRPVVVNDAIAVRSMIYLSLTFDHRVIDGAIGDQFMAEVKKKLETWDEKIL